MARGSIRRKRRADGIRYEAVVDIGPDPVTGRRRQKSWSYHTKREATAQLAKRIAEIDAGTFTERSTMTVAELMRYWLETYAEHNVRAVTLAGYRGTIERHILPALGAVRIQGLTAGHLQRFYAGMAKAEVGRRVIQLCHLRINQAYPWPWSMD